MLRRPRRNRKSQVIRNLVQETIILPQHLIYPLFLLDGQAEAVEVASMPGIFRMSLRDMLKEIESCMRLGLQSFVIFPVIEDSKKDNLASYGIQKNNFYVQALKQIKQEFPESCIVTDVAMDPYSSDGHDGIVENGKIINDKTLDILVQMALLQAEVGVDYIGPSDMMDGRVRAIREGLDQNGFYETGIMSYTAKYASSFYGPFRDALDSAPKFGDKKSYQMNPANVQEALIEMELDIQEGADILMVKPALSYLDVIQILRRACSLPIAAYNVSGEYAMVKAAGQKGWIDEKKVRNEILLSIKRAGADMILTYFAKEWATDFYHQTN